MFDVTVFGALVAGLLSFLSPCILPIVPFYLSYLAGASMAEITTDGALTRQVRMRAVLSAVLFAAGVITIFMALGAVATGSRYARRCVIRSSAACGCASWTATFCAWRAIIPRCCD